MVNYHEGKMNRLGIGDHGVKGQGHMGSFIKNVFKARYFRSELMVLYETSHSYLPLRVNELIGRERLSCQRSRSYEDT